ncbi:MAG: tetratricopeptide repeat protein [Chitinophagaceae bacterium]
MKQILTLIIFCMCWSLAVSGQKENAAITNGNNFYKKNNFQQSAAEYKKALTISPENPVASYNLGNAAFKSNDFETALGSYEAAIKNSKDKAGREKSFYNQGVTYSKQQKLAESIQSWKNALKLNADDNEARENLQKALLEKKKQDEEEKKKQDEKKKDDKKKDDKEKQDKDKPEQNEQPKPPQSKLNQKQVEQLLKALAQKEKELQDRMQSKNVSPGKQEKDW